MAFPGNSKTALATLWINIKDISGRVKDRTELITGLASLTIKQTLDYSNFLADSLASLDVLTNNASTNGLLTYAQAQENNAGLILSTEYNAMRAKIVATQSLIVANMPKDASSRLAVYTFDVNSRYADVLMSSVFSAAQITALNNQLSALAATIA